MTDASKPQSWVGDPVLKHSDVQVVPCTVCGEVVWMQDHEMFRHQVTENSEKCSVFLTLRDKWLSEFAGAGKCPTCGLDALFDSDGMMEIHVPSGGDTNHPDYLTARRCPNWKILEEDKRLRGVKNADGSLAVSDEALADVYNVVVENNSDEPGVSLGTITPEDLRKAAEEHGGPEPIQIPEGFVVQQQTLQPHTPEAALRSIQDASDEIAHHSAAVNVAESSRRNDIQWLIEDQGWAVEQIAMHLNVSTQRIFSWGGMKLDDPYRDAPETVSALPTDTEEPKSAHKWTSHKWSVWGPRQLDAKGKAYQSRTCLKCGKVQEGLCE